MKIYPSIHKIKPVYNERIDSDLNIPLAYVNTETTKYNITKSVSIEYNKDSMTELVPGQSFDDLNMKVFNKFKEEVNINDLLVREGTKYVYRPKKSTSFIPQTFLYKATIKKSLEYSSSKTYNMNASCVDDPDSLDLSQRLASILINPSDRNLLPSNISINKNNQHISSLTTGDLKSCDFLFIESPDGINYDDTATPMKIDFDSILDSHTNIWLSVDALDKYEIIDYGITKTFELKNSIVLNNKTTEARRNFNFERVIERPNEFVHNLFTSSQAPVLIEERVGKGFIIYSTNEVMQNPHKYASLIYEVMAYVYFNSYQSTDYLKEWIADELPDYQIENNILKKKLNFSSSMNLYNYFKLKSNELNLYNVIIYDDPESARYYHEEDTINSSSNVMFDGEKNGYLMFKKDADKTKYTLKDPEKPFGWKSIYTGSEIIYIDNIYYLIEESLADKIFTEEIEDNLKVTIAPFRKSLRNINQTMPSNITINFFKSEDNNIVKIRSSNYYFYVKNNKIDFCDEYDWNENLGELMFNIKVEQTNDSTTVFDMRQLGGGLPEDCEDNYDLLDIGHINGRPYRKAGTIIVTMPTSYEKYEDDILEAIKKYISADELPIIIFKDKEE